MLTNGYIDIGIVIVILRIMPTNPKTFWNAYGFTFILKKKDWNNKVVLKLQTPFYPNIQKSRTKLLKKTKKNMIQKLKQ